MNLTFQNATGLFFQSSLCNYHLQTKFHNYHYEIYQLTEDVFVYHKYCRNGFVHSITLYTWQNERLKSFFWETSCEIMLWTKKNLGRKRWLLGKLFFNDTSMQQRGLMHILCNLEYRGRCNTIEGLWYLKVTIVFSTKICICPLKLFFLKLDEKSVLSAYQASPLASQWVHLYISWVSQ